MSRFGRRSTALDVVQQINLQGKVVVITGATSGIGAEIARALAAAGAELILPARNIELGSAVADALITDTGNSKIRNYKLDLADFDSVRRFADNVLDDYPRVDILINNAGIMADPFQHCPQGYERHFSLNHLGHFLLTASLAKALAESEACRVVCVSAAAHGLSPIVFDDIHFSNRPYDKWLAYGQSKTANALFAKALNEKLNVHGGLAVAVNPGLVMSKLQRHFAHEEMAALGWANTKGDPQRALKSPAQGAAISAWAATAHEVVNLGGAYCENFQIAAPARAKNCSHGVHPHASNSRAAALLWELSEHLVDCQFNLPLSLNQQHPRPITEQRRSPG